MKGLALYELADQYQQALDDLTDRDDLPAEAIEDTLDSLRGDLHVKGINVAMYFRNLEAAADAIQEVEEKMRRRRERMQHSAKWMRAYLKRQMERCEIKEIESVYFTIALQDNPASVDIEAEALLPPEFVSVEKVRTISKGAIKAAIKEGRDVPGARLVQNQRLVVK